MQITEYKFANITARPLLTLSDVNNPYIFGHTRHVINMSDYREPEVAEAIKAKGATYDWFPTGERPMDVDMILLAVRELSRYDYEGAPIIVHCMGGNNRSRTVVEAYHFAKYWTHYEDEYQGSLNHLVWNCEQGYLPPLPEMEKLLKVLSPRRHSVETFGEIGGSRFSAISGLTEEEWRVFKALHVEYPGMSTGDLLVKAFERTGRYEIDEEIPKMQARLANALGYIKKLNDNLS